jgi:hypothetical protein
VHPRGDPTRSQREFRLKRIVCPHVVGIFAPHGDSFLDRDFSPARGS